MMDLIRLRVVLAFGNYRVGDVIERIPSVAKTMLKASWYGRKLVEEIAVPVAAPASITYVDTAGATQTMVPESLPTQNETPPKLTRPEPKYKKRG